MYSEVLTMYYLVDTIIAEFLYLQFVYNIPNIPKYYEIR